MFKSTDGGANWSQLTNSPSSVNALAVSPAYASDSTLFAGNNTAVLKSTDGGTNWTQLTNSPANVNAIVVSPAYASDAGVYRSTDGGTNWATLNDGLPSTNVAVLTISAKGVLFAGTNGGAFINSDLASEVAPTPTPTSTPSPTPTFPPGVNGWQFTESRNVYVIAVSPEFLSDGTVYVGTENSGVHRSTDSGNIWSQNNTGLPAGSTVDVLAISPDFQNDDTLFSSAASSTHPFILYKSTNRGDSWQKLASSPSNVNALAVSPAYVSRAQ